jgi:hypothetical protein
MGLESATYIHELVDSNPIGGSDEKKQGDDHIRLIKGTLLNTFPNVEGEVTASHTELNYLDGVTAPIEPMRGMAYSQQALPYSPAAGDNGTSVDLTNAGTLTLGNLANDFACKFTCIGGTVTVTSSSGNLEWANAAGTALPTGNRTVIRGGDFYVHRISGKWRISGSGIS